MSDKKRKKYFSILIACVAITVIITINIVGINNNTNDNSNLDNVEIVDDIFARKGISLVYLGRDTCSWSTKFEPNLIYLKEKYGFTYDYIDTDIYKGEALTQILNKLDINEKQFGTPTIVVIKDGEVQNSKIGYLDEKPLFDYLQENKIIKSEAVYIENINSNNTIQKDTEDKYENINYIEYKDFESLNNGKEPFILVVGQSGCSYCAKFKPVIDKVAKEKSVIINYIDIKKISPKDFESLISNIDYFDNNSNWGTPLTLIISEKKTIDNLSGYTDEIELTKFLKENNFYN